MQEAVLMPKKGMAQEHVAVFILAIIAGGILLWFVSNWKLAAEDISESEQCRASVLRNARYHFAGIDLGSEIDCPTRNLVLEKESGERAKEKIANAMYSCWRQFGRGELNLFSGEGVFCNVCYTIDVRTKEPITDLEDYLLETPSPEEQLTY